MIPANFLRKNLEQVKNSVEKRGADVDFDHYQSLEHKRKELQIKTEDSCYQLI